MKEPISSQTPPTVVQAANRRAGSLRLLVIHTMAFVAVNTTMIAVDVLDGGGFTAFRGALGWGIGLAIHAAVVLINGHPLDRWERRQADRLIADELARRQDQPWVVEPPASNADAVDRPRSRP